MSENIPQTPPLECLLSLWDCRSLATFLATQDVNPVWLFAGFKPETASLAKKPVRKRLVREMDKRDDLLLAFLRSRVAPWNEQQAVLEVLDEGCLLLVWRALLRNPQHRLALVAALAGDFRPRVAARALRLVRKRQYPWHVKADEEEGKPALVEVLQRLLFPKTVAELTEGERSMTAPGGKMKALQRQLEQANASNARLKTELRELKARCEKFAANEQTGDKDMKRELTRLRSELAALRESAERRMAARLAAQRARIFGVDGAFERLRLAARTPASDDLVAKTEAILAAQAKLDVKYGTVHALSRERERLLALLDSLDLASHNSIQPLPELNKTRREVATRIDYLNKLLIPAPAETDNLVAEELREAIVASSRSEAGMRQLNEAAALLHGALAEHFLAEKEKNSLLKTVAERKKWIGLLTREHSLAESLHELAGGKAPNADAPAADIWDMAFELRRSEVKPILLIDGYNALKSTASLAAVETREGMPAARKKLLDRLLANSDSFSAIRLVYDGRGAVGTRERHEAVEIVFARERGQGQHADDEIVDWLSTGKPAETPVWLATNDYGLRHRASRLCAGILSVEDLATWLNLAT